MPMLAEGGSTTFVIKGDLPLLDNETFEQFQERLRKAIIKEIPSMTLPHKVRHLWVCEVRDSSLVVELGWLIPRDEEEDITKMPDGDNWAHFQASWSSNGDGFSFSDWTEVERKTEWVPKAKVEKRDTGALWSSIV